MSFSGLPGRGSLANWGTGTVVPSSEFFWFEDCITKAIDGYAGGAYAPSSPIVLGGSGLQVTGPLVADGATEINGSALVTGNLTVAGGDIQLDSVIIAPVRFGTGGYIRRRFTSITTANSLVSIEDYDVVNLYGGAAGDLRLADFGETGALFRIINNTSGTIVVKNAPDGYTLYNVATQTWLELMRGSEGSHWMVFGRGTT